MSKCEIHHWPAGRTPCPMCQPQPTSDEFDSYMAEGQRLSNEAALRDESAREWSASEIVAKIEAEDMDEGLIFVLRSAYDALKAENERLKEELRLLINETEDVCPICERDECLPDCEAYEDGY